MTPPPESPESRSVQRRKAIQRGEPRPEFTESPAERLTAEIRPLCEHGERAACRFCQKEHIAWLRQAVTRLEAEVTRLTQQREEAEKAIEFARDGWSEVGARACPLCVYEAGVFKRRCKIHEYADALQARAEAAEAALHSATRAALLQAAEDLKVIVNADAACGKLHDSHEVIGWLTARAKESGA
jgi:hypothetical protein